MKKLYCHECSNYLMGGDGECHDCGCGWKQAVDKEGITGFIYTHWDCLDCGAANETEGDAKGEEVICCDCEAKFIIEGVR